MFSVELLKKKKLKNNNKSVPVSCVFVCVQCCFFIVSKYRNRIDNIMMEEKKKRMG